MNTAMCFLAVIIILVLSTLFLKLLWLVRIATLAHWSYLIGCAFYPQNAAGSMVMTASVFGVIVVGSIMPGALFPKAKLVSTALSIPPQLHMLFLLHRQVSRRINNDTVTKSVQAYTAMTLVSTVWTIFTLLWIYQSHRRLVNLRRLRASQARPQELNGDVQYPLRSLETSYS